MSLFALHVGVYCVYSLLFAAIYQATPMYLARQVRFAFLDSLFLGAVIQIIYVCVTGRLPAYPYYMRLAKPDTLIRTTQLLAWVAPVWHFRQGANVVSVGATVTLLLAYPIVDSVLDGPYRQWYNSRLNLDQQVAARTRRRRHVNRGRVRHPRCVRATFDTY